MKHLPENTISRIKTKLLWTCESYSKIRAPFKHKQVINDLARNRIVIVKQDKGREVVIMDKAKYQEKCLALFNTNQFVKLNRDPSTQGKTKIQRVLRKIKQTYHYKNIQVYIRLDLVRVKFMELRKYTTYHQQII